MGPTSKGREGQGRGRKGERGREKGSEGKVASWLFGGMDGRP